MSGYLCGSEPRAESLSPREGRNAGRMHRELADEVVVVVKRKAEENMVTYLRVTFSESAKEGGDEGRNMLT